MSLEDAIKANTVALEANTAALNKALEFRAEVLGKLQSNDNPPAETTGSGRTRRDRSAPAETATDPAKETRAEKRAREAAEAKATTDAPAADADTGRAGRRNRGAADETKDEGTAGRAGRRNRGEPAADKAKKLTIDDIRAAGANFLDVSKIGENDRDAEEDDRRSFLEAMLDELGLDKLTEAKPDTFEQITDWLTRFAAGEDVKFPSEGQ